MGTRFYFLADRVPVVSPGVLFSWTSSGQYVQRVMSPVKDASAIAIGSSITLTGNNLESALDRQYISEPLAEYIYPSLTLSGQLMVRESATNDNVDILFGRVGIIKADGTPRSSLSTGADVIAEFIALSTCRNKSLTTAGSTTTNVFVGDGDRFVCEIGYNISTSGVSAVGSAKYGCAAPDLPANETQTTDGAGWLEFSAPIYFKSFPKQDGAPRSPFSRGPIRSFPRTPVFVEPDTSVTGDGAIAFPRFSLAGTGVLSFAGTAAIAASRLAFTAASISPTTLDPTLLYIPPYGGSPWLPTASAGSSGSNGNLVAAAGAPSVGTPVDGRVPALLNGTTEALKGDTVTAANSYGTTALTAVVLFKLAGTPPAAPASDYYDDAALATDNNGVLGLTVSSSGVRAGVFPGSTKQTAHIALGAGWALAILRYDNVNVKCRVYQASGMSEQSFAATGALSFLFGTGEVYFGKNYNSTKFFSGNILETIAFQRAITDAECDGLAAFLQSPNVVLAGTGGTAEERFIATGAVASARLALAASGTYTPLNITGTCAINSSRYALSGVASLRFIATCAIASSRFALAGTGTVPLNITGTCAIAAPRYALAASGEERFLATCAISGSRFTLAATGAERFISTCAISSSRFALSATGAERFISTCAISGSRFAISASGEERFIATCAISGSRFTLSGAGNVPLNVTGTCAALLAPYSVAATAQERFISTGALTFARLALAGTAAERFISTGAVAFPRFTTSSAAQERFLATGSIQTARYAISGAGSESFAGAAAILVRSLAVSSTGALRFSASASLALASLALSASGTYTPLPRTGSGAITIRPYAFDGVGFTAALVFTGSGAITIATYAVSATGAERFIGSVSILMPPYALNAAGALRFAATAAVALRSLTLSATGFQALAVSGTGALTIASYRPNGAAQERFLGTGATSLRAYALTASGQERFQGSAAIALRALSFNATAAYTPLGLTGTGLLQFALYALAGAGTYTPLNITGTGDIDVTPFAVIGTGQGGNISGSGAIAIAGFTLSGTGAQIISARGAAVYRSDIIDHADAVITVRGGAAIVVTQVLPAQGTVTVRRRAGKVDE